MQLRLLRDYVVLGVWQLGGDIVDVDAITGERLLRAGIAEPSPAALETATLEPRRTAARTRRGKRRHRAE